MRISLKQRSVLPGFGLTLGYTLLYLSLVVLIPLSSLFLKAAGGSWRQIWETISDERVVDAFRLSFGASAVAASINAVFGFAVAWMLVRYRFPGQRVIDAMVDLPFALPTAVSGIALTTIYDPTGWIGRHLVPLGIQGTNSRLGVTIALTFIGLPFVVRTLQPALEEIDPEVEDAAASLGASRWQTLWWVIVPTVLPALLTGFALAYARALGEYGSVIFISGNLYGETEIVPLLIVEKLEGYNYMGAAVLATAMLIVSFVLLLLINLLQWWAGRHQRSGG
jgi:sulfate transport system permease protein